MKTSDGPLPSFVRVTKKPRPPQSRLKAWLFGVSRNQWDVMYADGTIQTDVNIDAVLRGGRYPADFHATSEGALRVAGDGELGRWVDYPYGHPADIRFRDGHLPGS